MLSVIKARKSTVSVLTKWRLSPRWIVLCLAAMFITATLVTTAASTFKKKSAVRCIKFDPSGQTREGIGAILQRNQLGVFLVETYSTKMSFPKIGSEHNYHIGDMFDQCDDPKPDCILDEAKMVLFRCPRSDCKCLRERVSQYTDEMAAKCDVIGYKNERVQTMEYSGCIKEPLVRYFGTGRKPLIPYDAMHFRAGDLALMKGAKAFSNHETFYILKAMCHLSNRDIVIMTEGNPYLPVIPECEDRLVLASDTSIQDVFRIAQHATTIALGNSSLAISMMEVASPTHVVMLKRVVPTYEWVDCEKWTIIANRGEVFHFDSKELMVDAALMGRELLERSYRYEYEHSRTRITMRKVKRQWSNDTKMSWITRKT